jgi:hypothetical protein
MHPNEERYARLRAEHFDEVRRAIRRHRGQCMAACESAAIVMGIPVFAIPAKAQLTRIDGARRNGRVRAVAGRLSPEDICMVDGVPVTSAARTVVDIARVRPFAQALVTADAVLRRGVPRGELQRVIAEMGRWPGVANARRVVQCADGRAESAPESVIRGRFILLGLEVPKLQVEVPYDAGWEIRYYRVDFEWERYLLFGEVDGAVKYTDIESVRAEKVRQERLEFDHVMIRWSFAQAVHSSDAEFVARLEKYMARGLRLRRLLATD